MCDACGCGDSELVPVALHERILASNDRTARHNREHFHDHDATVINHLARQLVETRAGSPGIAPAPPGRQ